MSQNSSDQCRGWKRVERKRERERESEEWRAEERVLEVFPRGLSELLAIVVMRTGWTAQEKKKNRNKKASPSRCQRNSLTSRPSSGISPKSGRITRPRFLQNFRWTDYIMELHHFLSVVYYIYIHLFIDVSSIERSNPNLLPISNEHWLYET